MNTQIAFQSLESDAARTARLYASTMAPVNRAPSRALTPFQVDSLVQEIVHLEGGAWRGATTGAQPS